MISKELEQELVDNELIYVYRTISNCIKVINIDSDIKAIIYLRDYSIIMYSASLKQAELIIKLAKEWQSGNI